MTPFTRGRGLGLCRTVLDNGAVAIAARNSTAPVVAINATFNVGSIHEPEHLPGLANFLGTMVDRGTASRTPERIAEELDDRGVALRVTVTRHNFTIASTCLADDFASIVTLLSDIVRNPMFPRDQLDKRRAEAITAVQQDADSTAVRATEGLLKLIYGSKHPYAWPSKGTIATLEAMDSDDLRRFHSLHITPSNLTVVVAGDVQPETAGDQIHRAFRDWTGPPAQPLVVPPPPAQRRQMIAIDMPGKAQADLAYGFAAIRRTDSRYYAYSILNNILGQFGLGGRLANSIREDQGMAYYAFSTFDGTVGEGPLVIRAGVDPRNVRRTLGAIDREVETLRRDGPTVAEVEESRDSLTGSIPRMLETNDGIAEFLQAAEQFGLGLDHDVRLGELLREVSHDAVRDAAAELLHTSHASWAVAGPGTGL